MKIIHVGYVPIKSQPQPTSYAKINYLSLVCLVGLGLCVGIMLLICV